VRRRRLYRLAWVAVFVLLSTFAVRALWLDVFHVDTGSMEPTIFGSEEDGDYVAVVFDNSPPERFELVVVLRKGTVVPVVKRVVGLPGEEVRLNRGDLLINTKRLGPDADRPPLVPIFEASLHDVAQAFTIGNSRMNPWTREGDVWSLDSRAVMEDADAGMMFLHKGIHDGYLDSAGKIVFGRESVNDAALESRFRFVAAEGRLRLLLNEWGDTFQAKVEPGAAGYAELSLTRRHRADSEDVLARTNVPLVVGEWHSISFANVDNHLSVVLDGVGVLDYAYEENHIHPMDLHGEGKSPAARAALGGEGARIDFEGIRVLRDLCWLQQGEYANDAPLLLGPDEIFVLGDHSAESRDGRSWGPVKVGEIVGRPWCVVWPPSRWRSLRPVR